MNLINIYTDGSSRGNPGKAGCAAILIYGTNRKEISKGYKISTNNRMELMSVIIALEELKKFDIGIIIYSDSQYVCNAFNKGWLDKWIVKNYNNVKNSDLWKKLADLIIRFESVKFVWVKGHESNVENNNCDKLAVAAALSTNLEEDYGYLENQKNQFKVK